MQRQAQDGKVVLGPGNFIQVGTFWSVILAIIGGTVWCVRMDNRIGNLEKSDQARDEAVSEQMFNLWVELTKAQNPSLTLSRLPSPTRRQ